MFSCCRLHMAAVMGLTGFRGILSWVGQKIIKTALCNLEAVGGSTQSHALPTSYLPAWFFYATTLFSSTLSLLSLLYATFLLNSLCFLFICSWKQKSVLYSHGTLWIPTQMILELISESWGALLAIFLSNIISIPSEFNDKSLPPD